MRFHHQVALEHVDQLAGSENFERTIATFDRNFTKLLKDLLSNILSLSSEAGGYNKLINLIYRQAPFNTFLEYTIRGVCECVINNYFQLRVEEPNLPKVDFQCLIEFQIDLHLLSRCI